MEEKPQCQQGKAKGELCVATEQEMSEDPAGLTNGLHRVPLPHTRPSLCEFGHIPFPTDPHYPTRVHRSSP